MAFPVDRFAVLKLSWIGQQSNTNQGSCVLQDNVVHLSEDVAHLQTSK